MITIKKNPKKHNEYTVTMKVTAGKILALKQALLIYGSPVAEDLLDAMAYACHTCGEPEIQN